jgi:hypothetical protein
MAMAVMGRIERTAQKPDPAFRKMAEAGPQGRT